MKPITIYTIRWLNDDGEELSTMTNNATLADNASRAGARVTAQMAKPR